MGRKNRQARKRLERIFGKIDMFDAAEIEKKIELFPIKGYKTFEQEQRFKGKPISQQLTFHHIKHKSDGGDQSIKNGSLIGLSHHEYMHSLPRDEEEIINNIIQDWKINFITMTGQGKILESRSMIPDFSECIEIPVYTTTVKEKKYREKKNPTRAQKKRECQKLIEEYEEDEFEI